MNSLIVALLLAALLSEPVFALSTMPDKPKVASISLGAEFTSGNYGTDTSTRSLYMPLIATWSLMDRFDIGVEVPFIYQSSSNVTTSLFSSSQSPAIAKTTDRGGPGGSSANQHQVGGATSSGLSTPSVSGLGDIIMRLGVIALFENDNAPQLRPSLFVKFPTANTSDGLGTGEFDVGAGLEATKWFGDLYLNAEGLYIYQGKAEGFGLKNYFSYTAAIGYQLTKSIEPMLLVKGATAPSDYSSSLMEARARVIWSMTGTTSLDLYGALGIADSSPDYGGGISIIYSF